MTPASGGKQKQLVYTKCRQARWFVVVQLVARLLPAHVHICWQSLRVLHKPGPVRRLAVNLRNQTCMSRSHAYGQPAMFMQSCKAACMSMWMSMRGRPHATNTSQLAAEAEIRTDG